MISFPWYSSSLHSSCSYRHNHLCFSRPLQSPVKLLWPLSTGGLATGVPIPLRKQCIRSLPSSVVITSSRSPPTYSSEQRSSKPQSLCYTEKGYVFPINHQDFCEMSSNAVVALENYPGMTQQSRRADEMGTHMTLLLWCNMALSTVCRENKQLRVICGEKTSPGRGINCTKKRKSRRFFTGNQDLCGNIQSCWYIQDGVCPEQWYCTFWLPPGYFWPTEFQKYFQRKL